MSNEMKRILSEKEIGEIATHLEMLARILESAGHPEDAAYPKQLAKALLASIGK